MSKNIQIHCKYDELINPKKLKNHPKNRNGHGQDQIERLAELYEYHGIRHPIIVSKQTGLICAGHGRKLAAIRAGIEEYPVVYQDFETTEAEYAFLQADNAIALWSELDLSGINTDIPDLGPDFDINMLGIKDFKLDPSELNGGEDKKGNMEDKFLYPPFSVLNARAGEWQDRKRKWISIGIASELGRGGELTASYKSQEKLLALWQTTNRNSMKE